jgi:hypothetical protein
MPDSVCAQRTSHDPRRPMNQRGASENRGHPDRYRRRNGQMQSAIFCLLPCLGLFWLLPFIFSLSTRCLRSCCIPTRHHTLPLCSQFIAAYQPHRAPHHRHSSPHTHTHTHTLAPTHPHSRTRTRTRRHTGHHRVPLRAPVGGGQ